ncbi:alanine--tRNA ligase-related protein [Agromyces seonyuensis]|uniref:alanine--tRNA ligase n=1 Tax=Agromyces seonyuensis TaxID=2662446 RepID=A0A6I4P178_9MICO|nr:alanine--tRNA ligase-related protein [Agromyces seonyuensis]MWB96977.1 hypothetical protein [Agromyces seonyuensis]
MERAQPLTADDIRSAFLELMVERGHVVIPRAPLVPHDDPTTLFTGSGMQPLLPYLLGAEHPAGRRLADSQTCLRVQDIDEVGDNRHTTFFEMLGNWSLGDYFKQEQIPQVWEFLTGRVGLDPHRIYVSCFSGDPEHGIPKDEESAAIWTGLFAAAGATTDQVDLGTEEHAAAVGTGGARIAFYSKKNWWCRGGKAEDMPIGEPGGPDTEMFYLFPQIAHDPAFGEHCHQNCDCGRFIELGNSVFMEYRRAADGFEPLPRRNVDYGGGLARIAAAAMDTPDVFRISLLRPIIERLEELSGRSYDDEQRAMRVIADHLRGATFLAVDGVKPSNKAQGYVMRRLVRRAIRFAFDLGLEENFFPQIIPTIASIYEAHFPQVAEHAEYVERVLVKEEQSFRRTLRKGLKQLTGFRGSGMTGVELFVLSDTFGFPLELAVEEAQSQGIELSPDWQAQFDEQLELQRARSRGATTLHV